MIPDSMLPFANHLWQSTLFVIAVWLMTLTLRKSRATVRHRLWLAASVKFLVPFYLLASIGSQLQGRTSSVTTSPNISRIVATLDQPFSVSTPTPSVVPSGTATAPRATRLPALLVGVWIFGVAASLSWWFIRWRRMRRVVRQGKPANIDSPLPVICSAERFEPGVFGIFKPVLLLPEGITDRLSPAQQQAVLAHEFCHARRRDNLAMAIHMWKLCSGFILSSGSSNFDSLKSKSKPVMKKYCGSAVNPRFTLKAF